jgi:hypothetical protein
MKVSTVNLNNVFSIERLNGLKTVIASCSRKRADLLVFLVFDLIAPELINCAILSQAQSVIVTASYLLYYLFRESMNNLKFVNVRFIDTFEAKFSMKSAPAH